MINSIYTFHTSVSNHRENKTPIWKSPTKEACFRWVSITTTLRKPTKYTRPLGFIDSHLLHATYHIQLFGSDYVSWPVLRPQMHVHARTQRYARKGTHAHSCAYVEHTYTRAHCTHIIYTHTHTHTYYTYIKVPLYRDSDL